MCRVSCASTLAGVEERARLQGMAERKNRGQMLYSIFISNCIPNMEMHMHCGWKGRTAEGAVGQRHCSAPQARGLSSPPAARSKN